MGAKMEVVRFTKSRIEVIKIGHEKLFTTDQHLSAKCSRDCSHRSTEQSNPDTHVASINPSSGLHDDCFLVVLFITGAEFFSLVIKKKKFSLTKRIMCVLLFQCLCA